MTRPIAGMNAAEILAKFSPTQIFNEVLEDLEGWTGVETEIKKAWKAVPREQQTAAMDSLSEYHKRKVDVYRAAHGYDQIDWSEGGKAVDFIGADGVRRPYPLVPAPGSINNVVEALRKAGLRK